MAQRTPLYAWHSGHGARLVEFGGWDMPVQYTGIVEEHQAVRGAAGIFDISHMGRLFFSGPDALAWIQQVYTNNAATLKDGQVRYGLVCNTQGGIRDDVLVYRLGDGYAMVVNASNRAKIVAWLQEHRGQRQASFEDRTTATCMVAVQGPTALAMCRGLTAADAGQLGYYFAVSTTWQGRPCLLSRTGYTGEDGVELVVDAAHAVELWEELVKRGARPCGLGARDTLRLEAAMPLYGHELTEDIDPLQAGLGWAVKLDKGDFLGREALLRRQQDPSRRVRVGLELEGKRIAREGAGVLADDRPVGVVTSGTFAPTVSRAIAMAYVDPDHSAVGTGLQVDVRGKKELARVVALPFYRRAKK
jgi:aminomethyltransferase